MGPPMALSGAAIGAAKPLAAGAIIAQRRQPAVWIAVKWPIWQRHWRRSAVRGLRHSTVGKLFGAPLPFPSHWAPISSFHGSGRQIWPQKLAAKRSLQSHCSSVRALQPSTGFLFSLFGSVRFRPVSWRRSWPGGRLELIGSEMGTKWFKVMNLWRS